MEGDPNTANSSAFCATGWGLSLQGFGQGARTPFSFLVVPKGQRRIKFYL